jgi:hypothetical protein
MATQMDPFIQKLLYGGQPTPFDFMQGPMQQKIGTPGFNPNAPDPRLTRGDVAQPQKPGMLGTIDKFLTSPGGGFLMNLLADSGYSPVPQSPMGAVGKAALMTQQQQQARGMTEAQRRLIESQIGLNRAKADPSNPMNATAGNVQSTFKGDNGNMWVFTRGSTEPVDTGVKFDSSIKTFEMADGSVVAVDSDGQRIGTVVTPEEARGATTRQSQTEASLTLPTELAGLDSTINTADATIAKIQEVMPLVVDENVGIESRVRGDLPGFLGGDPRKLKQEVKSLQANFGFDTLQKMRAASKTGGALGQVSERELDLLINALRSIDIEGDVPTLKENLNAVITHYENYKREIEVMKNAMREQAGQPAEDIAPSKQPRRRRYNPETKSFEDV